MTKNKTSEVRLTETRVEKSLGRDWSGLTVKEQYWPHSPWRAFGMAFRAE